MKRKGIIFLLVIFFILDMTVPVWAQERTAKVVDKPIELNGVEMNFMSSTQYPFLVYKDVTYFPMTWYNCRMLGLETTWSAEDGLMIKQNNAMTSSMGYYSQDQLNPEEVQVTIPNFKVTVNQQVIDNGKEQYPLLNFRDVTYFPLTWRFAHEAFGWDYNFTQEEGLQITSHNPQTIAFPALSSRELQTPIKILDDGCYYYLERDVFDTKKQVRVSRAPVDNRFRKQELYTFSGQPEKIEFALLDQVPYILYKMETGDQQQALRVKEDGSVEPVQLNLVRYTNGSSTGDRQNGWQYAIRDGKLCRSRDGSSWQTYSQKSAVWFGLLEGQVYYLHKRGNDVGEFYQIVDGSAKDKLVTKENVRNVTIEDGYLVCCMERQEDYGAKIFDGQGKLVLAIAGQVDLISVSAEIVMVSSYADERNEYLKVIYLTPMR